MKIYFMKQEALDILKENLEVTYNKYYTERDNKWMWDVCGGNPFVEYKEVPDFQLANLVEGISKGEIEFNNCKILYQNLMFLNESQASDERLWAGLCHSVFYDYVRKRWDYDSKQKKTTDEAVSNIKSRFFFSGGIRAGLYRNTLAKCWWVGRNTYNSKLENKFEALDIIGSNDISSKISDIFYSNTFSANPVILKGIVNGIKHFKESDVKITLRDHIRPSLQVLNAIGGGVILDCLDENDISNIIIDSILSIIDNSNQGMVINDEVSEENTTNGNEQVLDINRVALGDKIKVFLPKSEETKTIRADYLQGTNKLPPLVEILLGKCVGYETEFNDKIYIIVEIL